MKYQLFITILLPLAWAIDDNNDVVKMLYNFNRVPHKDSVAFDKGYIKFYNKYEDILSSLRDKERYDDLNYGNQAVASHDFGNRLEPYKETIQNDIISNEDSRTVKKWFKDVLQSAKTTSPTESILTSQNDDSESKSVAQTLLKMTNGIELLNENLAKANSALQIIYHDKKFNGTPPQIEKEHINRAIRSKRDVSNETLVVSTQVKKSEKDNVASTKSEVNAKLGNQTAADKDGRRMNSIDLETKMQMKAKLLVYLDNAFNDLQKKLLPIHDIKPAFISDNIYKIGYVMAILDTLEANIKKLKADSDNKYSWDDTKTLELFDKLNVLDNVVTGLLVSLRGYIEAKKQEF